MDQFGPCATLHTVPKLYIVTCLRIEIDNGYIHNNEYILIMTDNKHILRSLPSCSNNNIAVNLVW